MKEPYSMVFFFLQCSMCKLEACLRLKGIFKYAQQHEEAQLARSNQLDGVKFWTSQDKWDQWLERDMNLENPHAKVPLTAAPCSPEDSQHFGKMF